MAELNTGVVDVLHTALQCAIQCTPLNKHRQYATLNELMTLHLPNNIDINHDVQFDELSVLYCIDNHCHNIYTLADIVQFVQLCYTVQSNIGNSMIYHNPIHSYCLIQLHNKLCSSIDSVADWLLQCCVECNVSTKQKLLHDKYVTYDAVQPLYVLFKQYMNGITMQTLFDQLQHCSELSGLLDIENSVLDDYVHIDTVRLFIYDILCSMKQTLEDIGLDNTLNGQTQTVDTVELSSDVADKLKLLKNKTKRGSLSANTARSGAGLSARTTSIPSNDEKQPLLPPKHVVNPRRASARQLRKPTGSVAISKPVPSTDKLFHNNALVPVIVERPIKLHHRSKSTVDPQVLAAASNNAERTTSASATTSVKATKIPRLNISSLSYQ